MMRYRNKVQHDHVISSRFFSFHFRPQKQIEAMATNQSWKQRLLVESVYFRHICRTVLELFHEMSHIDDCDCAMFVSQHCSANIKASAQGSS